MTILQTGTLWLIAIVAVAPSASLEQAPGTAVEYLIERSPGRERDLRASFTAGQLAVLEKLNRADTRHLHLLDRLVVPTAWLDERQYSPFPLTYRAAASVPKLVVVDQRAQAFAAYESGRLARWGPVSSGRQASATPSGRFSLNWRSRGRHSTVDPSWYMEWYFNFDNRLGLSFHRYALPGYPASHGCIRLLERDAMWLYEWGEPGTALLVIGQYAFDAPPPWRSPAFLARGIELPEDG